MKTYLLSSTSNEHLLALLLLWLENAVAISLNYLLFINERIFRKVGCVCVFVVIISARSYIESLKNTVFIQMTSEFRQPV